MPEKPCVLKPGASAPDSSAFDRANERGTGIIGVRIVRTHRAAFPHLRLSLVDLDREKFHANEIVVRGGLVILRGVPAGEVPLSQRFEDPTLAGRVGDAVCAAVDDDAPIVRRVVRSRSRCNQIVDQDD